MHSTGLLSRETFHEYQTVMTAFFFFTAFHICKFVHNYFKDRNCSKMCASSKNSPSPMRGGSGPVFSKLMTTPLWTFWTRDSRHWFNILCVRTQYDRPEKKTGGTTIRCNQENYEYYKRTTVQTHDEYGKRNDGVKTGHQSKKLPNLQWLHTSGWWRTHLWGRCQAARFLAWLLQAASAPTQTDAGPSGRALWSAHCLPTESSEAGAAGRQAR